MTRDIRAHFDGRVFVPDEPVDVPVNQPLRLRVENGEAAGNGHRAAPSSNVAFRLEKLREITGVVKGPVITSDSLRRENLYDDRL